jgi:hypothetical protein
MDHFCSHVDLLYIVLEFPKHRGRQKHTRREHHSGSHGRSELPGESELATKIDKLSRIEDRQHARDLRAFHFWAGYGHPIHAFSAYTGCKEA